MFISFYQVVFHAFIFEFAFERRHPNRGAIHSASPALKRKSCLFPGTFMPHCFTAVFEPCLINGKTKFLRHNTRLWFERPESPTFDGVCLGAVVGLNPGSAKGDAEIGRETFGECDPTMQRVLKTFEIAFKLKGVSVPEGAYVQLLNLFYLRDARASAALAARDENPQILADARDKEEGRQYPFLWLAWGKSARADDVDRFLDGRTEKCCWVDSRSNFSFEPPEEAWMPAHPLCRTKGFKMAHNAEMIVRML